MKMPDDVIILGGGPTDIALPHCFQIETNRLILRPFNRYSKHMGFRILCYCFFRLLLPKRFAIGLAITHLFGSNRQKNQLA